MLAFVLIVRAGSGIDPERLTDVQLNPNGLAGGLKAPINECKVSGLGLVFVCLALSVYSCYGVGHFSQLGADRA